MHSLMNRTTVGALLVACAALTLGGCDPLPRPQPEPAPEHRSSSSHHRGHSKHRPRGEKGPVDSRSKGDHEGARRHAADVPEKVTKVLRYVDEHRRAPEGYEGGRDFHNAGASGQRGLRKTDADGKAIAYREWDVNPKERGVNRGAERLITGSDGSAYYTDDHYRTFEKVR
jgi:ribonuclease T1